jgi:hypothetical protein
MSSNQQDDLPGVPLNQEELKLYVKDYQNIFLNLKHMRLGL